MPKRVLSLLLALLYISVSLGVSASHDHHHSEGYSKNCVACGWLAQSVADAPAAPASVRPPSVFFYFHASPEVIAISGERLVRCDRGPPALS